MLESMRTVEMEETPGAGRFVERGVGERNETPGARAAAEGSRPDPELAERPSRRRFTAEYKLRILREAAGATRAQSRSSCGRSVPGGSAPKLISRRLAG